MIKVKRTSPDYLAIQFTGSCEELAEEIHALGNECVVTAHTRIGDTEALYAMIELTGQMQPIFIQKGEWILFNQISHTFVTTLSDCSFRYNFKEDYVNETA